MSTTFTLAHYDSLKKDCLDKKDKKGAKEYAKIIERLEKVLPCQCGSMEFYLAPIVHIRCANCNKPL